MRTHVNICCAVVFACACTITGDNNTMCISKVILGYFLAIVDSQSSFMLR